MECARAPPVVSQALPPSRDIVAKGRKPEQKTQASRLGFGHRANPLYRKKKLSIIKTGNSNKQFHMGNSTTTYLNPNGHFITRKDGLMTGASSGVS